MVLIKDPILGEVEVGEPPEKVTMRDLWISQQMLKVSFLGFKVSQQSRNRLVIGAVLGTWGVILVILSAVL